MFIAMWLVVDVKPLFNIIVADIFATLAGGIASFWLFSIFNLFCDEIISRSGVQIYHQEIVCLQECHPSIIKKNSIILRHNEFSPSTAEVCEPQRKLASMKSEWTWEKHIPEPIQRAKSIIKREVSLIEYSEKEQLSRNRLVGCSLRASLWQVRDGVWLRNTWQCSTVANSIYKEESDKCRNMI